MHDTLSGIVVTGFATFICFWIAYYYYLLVKKAQPTSKSHRNSAPGCLSVLFVRRYDASPTEMMWTFLVLGVFSLLSLILIINRSG